MKWGTGAFSRGATGESDLPLCCNGILGVPFTLMQENEAFLELRGTQCHFDLRHEPRVPLEFQ